MFVFLESIDFQMYYPLIELSYLAIFKVFNILPKANSRIKFLIWHCLTSSKKLMKGSSSFDLAYKALFYKESR